MAFDAYTESALLTLDQDFEAFTDGTDALVHTLTPREILTLVVTTRHDGAGTDDVEIQILAGHRVSTGNTLDGATSASDVELDTAADGFSNNDELNGYWLVMTSGTAQGEARLIVDSVAADDGVNLSHAFTAGIAGADSYDLYRFAPIQEFTIDLADPAADDPLSVATSIMGFQYAMVIARMSGATDTPDVRLSYSGDGVSA